MGRRHLRFAEDEKQFDAMSPACCERMAYDLNQQCEVHPDRADCPDALVATVRGGYGLMVHDGGSSVIEIAFCPWCGSKLPEIGDLGLDEPENEQTA